MSSPQDASTTAGALPFWSRPEADLLAELGTTAQGLTSTEAAARLVRYGPNSLETHRHDSAWALLLRQFANPIIAILLFAAGLSAFLGDRADAVIILAIVLVSGLLGYWQEHGAAGAVAKLLEMVQTTVQLRRDGKTVTVPLVQAVPGDIVLLNAGGSIPGDCRLLESDELSVDEVTLTGETYPVEKQPSVLPADTGLSKRTNSLFMGTHVVSGTAVAVVAKTGLGSEFGALSSRLSGRPAETEFEHGVRRFGFFLAEVTLVLVLIIFAVNVALSKPWLDSFMFSLALAVGLTPQMLPAIITVNLSHGARRMAEKKVIVRRLSSIEDFGSMNLLCSDKTGTLTEGVVTLDGALGLDRQPNPAVLRLAWLNAKLQAGFTNPIDDAIRAQTVPNVEGCRRLGEVPYDFLRKRLSVLVAEGEQHLLITKGALANVMQVCTSAQIGDQVQPLDQARATIHQLYEELSGQGFRTLGVATRDLGAAADAEAHDEQSMTLVGVLTFHDPPKAGVAATVQQLADLGISLRMITGDNELVAATVARQVGIPEPRVMTGDEMRQISDRALQARIGEINVFAAVEPNQKERIIQALRKAGNVVGYMGDGINDASALYAADVGISVQKAVDVAREAADLVLLEQDLQVLVEGVKEGRVTFANTLKYVFMATSANFGNMVSMAGASLFLPFLPLLPKQILLTNLLTDCPELAIASDSVDPEAVTRPRRWDLKFIRRFMMTFGLISSVFDYSTFAVLWFVLKANTPQQEHLFQTGWFVESVVSASLIVLVVRTRRSAVRSMPGRLLAIATLAVAVGTVALPYTPLGPLFTLQPLPPAFLVWLLVIVAVYATTADLAKRFFYRANPM